MASETDDVPPLEDMSELLNQVEKLREFKNTQGNAHVERPVQTLPRQQNGGIIQAKVQKPKEKKNDQTEDLELNSNDAKLKTDIKKNSTTTTPKESVGTKNQSFGGFKKGFLFGGGASNPTTTKTKSVPPKSQAKQSVQEDIPFIKKNEESSPSSKFAFSEVQKAMEASNNFLQNKEWVTEGLLEKVEKNETLAKRLTDPAFAQAISEFQTNPQAATVKYQGNPEVQAVFSEFCKIMGDHFTALGDAQETSSIKTQDTSHVATRSSEGGVDMSVKSSTNPNQPTAEDERKMQEILSNPEVANILVDPWIQKLLEKLKNNPAEGQRMLQEAEKEKQMKLKKLVDAGILQFQR